MTRFAALLLAALVAPAPLAQAPASDLAKPPANARHFIILSAAGPHGESWAWKNADGTRMSRETLNLRGQVFELDATGAAGSDGMPRRLTIRSLRREMRPRVSRSRAAARAGRVRWIAATPRAAGFAGRPRR